MKKITFSKKLSDKSLYEFFLKPVWEPLKKFYLGLTKREPLIFWISLALCLYDIIAILTSFFIPEKIFDIPTIGFVDSYWDISGTISYAAIFTLLPFISVFYSKRLLTKFVSLLISFYFSIYILLLLIAPNPQIVISTDPYM